MPLNTQIQKISEETFEELERPSNLNPSFISNWYINNAGQINGLVGTSFSGVSDSGITPLLGEDDVSLYKLLFHRYYYKRETKSNLGALGYNFVEISEGDSKVVVPRKTEIAKNLRGLSQDTTDEINRLSVNYRTKRAIPVNVVSSGATTIIY